MDLRTSVAIKPGAMKKPGVVFRAVLTMLASVMLALAFPRASWTYLAPFAFVPVLWATMGLGVLRATLVGWIWGICAYSIGCVWMLDAVRVSQERSVAGSVAPFALSILYHGAQFGVFTGVMAWFRGGDKRVPPVATACSWVLLEWMYPKFAHWSVGDLAIDWPLVSQVADIGGTACLGFLILTTAIVLHNWIIDTFEDKSKRWVPVAVLACAYGLCASYGAVRQQHFEHRDENDSVNVLILQAALPVGEKNALRASERNWQTYSEMTLAHDLQGVDILFWPETTIRDYLLHGSQYAHKVKNLAATLRANLVLGALDLPTPRGGEYSATYLVEPDGTMQRAHKLHLVPFGEYVPWKNTMPILSSWQTTGSFIPGVDHPILVAGDMRMATSICIEATRPGFNHNQVLNGATVLVNLSNDGWFGHSAVPYIHLQSVRWRAVETRRWLIRASDSGISAVIDPTGRIAASIPYGEAGAIRETVYPQSEVTIFVRWGNWFLWLLGAAWLCMWLKTLQLKRRPSSQIAEPTASHTSLV